MGSVDGLVRGIVGQLQEGKCFFFFFWILMGIDFGDSDDYECVVRRSLAT